MLQNALNKNLTMAFASNHILPDNNYNEWVNIVNRVAQQLEIVDSRFYGRRGYTYPDVDSRHGNRENETTPKINTNYGLQNSHTSNSFDSHLGDDGDMDNSGDTILGGVNRWMW